MEIVKPSDDESQLKTGGALNELMDISADEVERDALLDSRCIGRIEIELDVMPKDFQSRYLDFFLSHLSGRGAIGSVLEDGALLISFGVLDTSDGSQQLIRDFAVDITKILGQSESTISEVEIHTMTDERLRRTLADLGISFPGPKLTLVSDPDV